MKNYTRISASNIMRTILTPIPNKVIKFRILNSNFTLWVFLPKIIRINPYTRKMKVLMITKKEDITLFILAKY